MKIKMFYLKSDKTALRKIHSELVLYSKSHFLYRPNHLRGKLCEAPHKTMATTSVNHKNA